MFLLFLGVCFTIDSLYEIDEVVVTATRYPVTLQHIALATEVITSADIKGADPLTIGEVLEGCTGLTIRDYGSPAMLSSPAIRGVPANGVLVLVDGCPLNQATTGTADLNAVDVNAVQRIEVVKGPVSSLYGANALGGVINIITIHHYDRPAVSIKYMPSTTSLDTLFQNTRLALTAGLPWGPLSLGISGGYLSSVGTRLNSDHEGYSIGGNLVYQAGSLHLRSAIAYSDREYGVPGPLPPDSGSVTSPDDRERDRLFRSNVDIHGRFSDLMTYHGTVYGDRITTHFTGDEIAAGIFEEYQYQTNKIGFNGILRLDLVHTSMTWGIDFRYDTLDASEYSLFSDTSWKASTWNTGTWLEFTTYITDLLALSPSVRLDRNQIFGLFLSPHLGVIQRYGDMFFVKASVGKSFRAPTLNDMYYPLSGNEELRPEHGWSYEIRLEGMPAHYIFAAFSFYIRDVLDRITWLPLDEHVWRPYNMNRISMKGLDVESRIRIGNNVEISLQGTALEARQRNNEVVYDFYDYGADTSMTIIQEIQRKAAFIPDYSLFCAIEFELPLQSRCGVRGHYMSEQVNYYPNYDDYPYLAMDTKRLAPHGVFDLYIQRSMHRFVSLSMGAKNILDARYASQFGYSMYDRDFPMPERTLYVEVSAHY